MENKSNEKYIGVHHGAREIEIEALIQDIPGIENIDHTIKQFRDIAYVYHAKFNTKDNFNNERFNNNISILGNRGMGKSSVLLSIMREISTNRVFKKDRELGENTIDIINRMIDPEDISDNSDILGWVMAALFEQIEKLEVNDDKSLSYYFNDSDDSFEKLKTKKEELIQYYSIYGKEYSDIALNKSINKYDYYKNLNEILTCDYKLHKCFMEFINLFVKVKRKINIKTHKQYSCSKVEPLIYFFFDDVDTSSKKSIKILTDILSFFSHPNIVIFISGDYSVFKQSVMNHFMSETKDITLKMTRESNENEVKFARDRAEYFLKKVIPPTYRYYISENNNDAMKINYHYRYNVGNDFEKKDIFQLITYIFSAGFDNDFVPQDDYYLKCFMLPEIYNSKSGELEIKSDVEPLNKAIKVNNKSHVTYLYAYLSIFSVNRRGFMNMYNYLCKEANYIYENNIQNANDFWNVNKFREFIQNIINSKHTYGKYEKNIKRFLSIKLDNLNVNDTNKSTMLRIDCEELELFVKEMLKKLTTTNYSIVVDDNSDSENNLDYIKNEIKCIIMLPILLNELFYVICGNSYRQRYLSLQNKLKNILVKVFINSLNDEIIILPTQLGMRRTLCLFQHITSRMSTISLNNLRNFYNQGYNNSNNKKYIVQLYLATIELGSVEVDNEGEPLFDYEFYNKYKISTYSNLDERSNYEKEIAKKMNIIYRHLDRVWLADKIKFSIAMEPTIYKVEYIVHNQFLELFPVISISEVYQAIDEMYVLICAENDIHKKYNLGDNTWSEDYFSKLFEILEKISNNEEEDFNIYRTVKKINSSNFELKKELYTNSHTDLHTELTIRIKNQNSPNNESIKNLVNLLDDFKSEFEILINRLSNLYDDYYEIDYLIENQLNKFFTKNIDEIDKYILGDIIDEQAFYILVYSLEKNKEQLITSLKQILKGINNNIEEKINLEADDINNLVAQIADYLLRINRKQERVSSQELELLKKTVLECIKPYYLYVFLLEAFRIYEENDTKFFRNFKTEIEYKGEDKKDEK